MEPHLVLVSQIIGASYMTPNIQTALALMGTVWLSDNGQQTQTND